MYLPLQNWTTSYQSNNESKVYLVFLKIAPPAWKKLRIKGSSVFLSLMDHCASCFTCGGLDLNV